MAIWVYNPKNGSFECAGSEPVTTDTILKIPATIRLGSSSNYIQIDDSGNMTLVGSATIPETHRSYPVKLGGASDYVNIDSSGNLSYVGNAMRWEDSMVPAVAFRSGLSALTFDAITTNLYAYRMDVSDVAHLVVQLPHAMAINTVIKPHLHIVNKDANNSLTNYKTKWTLTYMWANINAAFPGEVVATPITVSFQNTAALTHKLVQFGDITPIAGQGGISSILLLAVGRIAADDFSYAGTDIYTLGFDIHVEVNTPGGSADPTSK